MKENRVLHFVKKPEIRKYSLQNINIELKINEKVFPPSPHGSFFAQNIKINPGEKVIDIGTGTGILGILAAKLGCKVYATDNSEDAIELAKENAKLNKVEIEFHKGEYFAEIKDKFDVILANLPQEIVHENYQKAIGEKLTKSFSGGLNGNEQILKFLELAKNNMNKNSRIYLIVYTVTDYKTTLKEMIKNYNAKLVAFDSAQAKEFVQDNIEFYLELNKSGKICIFNDNGTWKANEYLFELTLKKID